jgi:hypothetical protein
MKTKLIAVVSAMAVSWLALSFANTAIAQKSGGAESGAKPPAPATTPSGTGQAAKGSGGATVATPITPEEAAKKYPAPKGGAYPPGERDPHKPSGQISSPYPPHDVYDCSNIAHGGLVLDTHVKKVFVRP